MVDSTLLLASMWLEFAAAFTFIMCNTLIEKEAIKSQVRLIAFVVWWFSTLVAIVSM